MKKTLLLIILLILIAAIYIFGIKNGKSNDNPKSNDIVITWMDNEWIINSWEVVVWGEVSWFPWWQ